MFEAYVLVPWSMLRTTPELETFLLDATIGTLQNAPSVDPAQLADRDAFSAASKDVENYWQEQQPVPGG